MPRRKNFDALQSTLMLLAGAGLSYAGILLLRRKASEMKACIDKVGSTPHTDFDAAAKIGRETGGEIFDD